MTPEDTKQREIELLARQMCGLHGQNPDDIVYSVPPLQVPSPGGIRYCYPPDVLKGPLWHHWAHAAEVAIKILAKPASE